MWVYVPEGNGPFWGDDYSFHLMCARSWLWGTGLCISVVLCLFAHPTLTMNITPLHDQFYSCEGSIEENVSSVSLSMYMNAH